jgi:hypothetical protein
MVNETFPSMRLIAPDGRKSTGRDAAAIEKEDNQREDGEGDAC